MENPRRAMGLSAGSMIARQPDEPKSDAEKRRVEREKRIDRIEAIIVENWKQYITKAKLKSPLKQRIKWYEDDGKLYAAKWELARTLANRRTDAMDEAQRKAAIEKHKGVVTTPEPGFEDVREYVVMEFQNEYFTALGGDEVPAFYNQFDQMIHTSTDKVDAIAHEALHYYGSAEFREVFGTELDEGMTQYLAEQVAFDYLGKYIKEGGIAFSISDYSKSVAEIKDLIKSGQLKKRSLVRGYFSGGKNLLRRLKKIINKARAMKEKKK